MSWSCGRSRKLKNFDQNLNQYILSGDQAEDFSAFTSKNLELHLDIGFGIGDSIVQTLEKESVFVIGCEIFKPAILNTLKIVDPSRVALFMEYSNNFLSKIPSASISEIKMLFPDPWPKHKHRMRRCYNIKRLDLQIARILKSDGKFIFASDVFNIAKGMKNLFSSDFFKIESNQYNSYDECPHKTSYARKGFIAGRNVHEMIISK